MGKGDLRVNLFGVEDFGVRHFPAAWGQAAKKAGLIAQFAGAARGPHFKQQLVSPAVEADLDDFLEMARSLPFGPPCASSGRNNGGGRWRRGVPWPPGSTAPASAPLPKPRPGRRRQSPLGPARPATAADGTSFPSRGLPPGKFCSNSSRPGQTAAPQGRRPAPGHCNSSSSSTMIHGLKANFHKLRPGQEKSLTYFADRWYLGTKAK